MQFGATLFAVLMTALHQRDRCILELGQTNHALTPLDDIALVLDNDQVLIFGFLQYFEAEEVDRSLESGALK